MLECGAAAVDVYLNNQLELNIIHSYDAIVLSPGPGLPKDAGIMPEVIHHFVKKKPMLGVCLGHQAIGEYFGACLVNLSTIFHGVSRATILLTPIDEIFTDIPLKFDSGRYHSWAIEKETLPCELQLLAQDEQGVLMAFRHKSLPAWGLQFHPESILTPEGKHIIKNWIQACKRHLLV